mgnify:CR=1 FL=1
MADEQLGLFDAIYSQRAIRSLKPDPVPDDVLHKIIEAGTKAPSGGNSQPWAFIIVQDHDSIAKIAEWAKAGFAVMYERALGRMRPGDELPFPRLKPLVESMEQVPVLLFPCHVRPEGAAPSPGGMSIYPAVQNMLLAARSHGVGGVLVTMFKLREDGFRELLDLSPWFSDYFKEPGACTSGTCA